MKVSEIDTPALLIDREIVLRNLQKMQSYADAAGVSLRPHTKTHKMPYFAKL
jgi:glnD family protein